MSGYTEARERITDARARCLQTLAAAYGCATVEELPTDVLRAVVVFGQECFELGMDYVHEAATIPAPPTSSTYSEQPTRVDYVFGRRRRAR